MDLRIFATVFATSFIAEGDCSPGKAGGIQVSRSKRLDGAATRPLEPPYGGPTIS